jgi:hypothetical protein
MLLVLICKSSIMVTSYQQDDVANPFILFCHVTSQRYS